MHADFVTTCSWTSYDISPYSNPQLKSKRKLRRTENDPSTPPSEIPTSKLPHSIIIINTSRNLFSAHFTFFNIFSQSFQHSEKKHNPQIWIQHTSTSHQ